MSIQKLIERAEERAISQAARFYIEAEFTKKRSVRMAYRGEKNRLSGAFEALNIIGTDRQIMSVLDAKNRMDKVYNQTLFKGEIPEEIEEKIDAKITEIKNREGDQ